MRFRDCIPLRGKIILSKQLCTLVGGWTLARVLDDRIPAWGFRIDLASSQGQTE